MELFVKESYCPVYLLKAISLTNCSVVPTSLVAWYGVATVSTNQWCRHTGYNVAGSSQGEEPNCQANWDNFAKFCNLSQGPLC